MAIRRLAGEELRDCIQNLDVEARLTSLRASERGWIEKYFLPEYKVYATFGCLFEPERRAATKIRGDEANIKRLKESLSLAQ